jgi:HlyD family type I secretion membrane fusion protein
VAGPERTRALPSLADALHEPMTAGADRASGRRLAIRAGAALGAVLAALLVWSAMAPLSGAVIATGVVKAELNRKTVQHQEGGIVRAILVRDGQRVRAGEPLLVVGDVRTDAAHDLLQDQRLAELIRQARLVAELKMAAGFELPQGLAGKPNADDYLSREHALFEARRRTLLEQVESFRLQSQETEAQVQALTSQIAVTEHGAALAREELELNRKLLQDGFVQRARLLALERAVVDYDSQTGEQRSERALARQRLAELRSRVVQARNQYQQQAATELKETVARLSEIDERLRPSRDQVERQYVRSPVDGVVMSLRPASVGAAIGPREPLLDVVPVQEPLVVEAHVRPEDIDYVRAGAPAEVRLTAYEYRTMPTLPARILSVSADRLVDPASGTAWFSVLLQVDAAELTRFPGVRMQAGMPAEVFVTTAPRSLFSYLLVPLLNFSQRGLREP